MGVALGPTDDPPMQFPQSLATDLEEAEEQHAQALRSHLYNIDRLLCLEEGYNAQLEALKMELEAERYGSLRVRGGERQQWHPLAILSWC